MQRRHVSVKLFSNVVFILFAVMGFIAVSFIYSTYAIKITVLLFVLQLLVAFGVGLFAASISVIVLRKLQAK